MKMKQGVSQLLVEWWFNHIFIQGMVLYILFISSVVSMLGFSLSEHINGISHLLPPFLFLTMLLLPFDSVDFTSSNVLRRFYNSLLHSRFDILFRLSIKHFSIH